MYLACVGLVSDLTQDVACLGVIFLVGRGEEGGEGLNLECPKW